MNTAWINEEDRFGSFEIAIICFLFPGVSNLLWTSGKDDILVKDAL